MRTINFVHAILLAILLAGSTACEKKSSMPKDMSPAMIVGMNYTDKGVQQFYVNERWGGKAGAYLGGSEMCCLVYPKVWKPGLSINLKWEVSDGMEADGKTWKYRVIERVIAIPQYSEPGDLYVLFLPDDKVEIYISKVGVGHPTFPGKRGYPVRPSETTKE